MVLRRAVVAAIAVLAVATAAPRLRPAAAATTHHAAVVVDLGDGSPVRSVCVGFAEDSLTGKQVLERAGVDPVFRTYSANGSAVCALCGKGCPPDDSCLTCQDPNYWAYHRAPAGASSFTASRGGVSSTTVHDGDVEGWKWGTGGAPAYRSFADVCGTTASGTSAGSGGSGGSGGGGAPATTTTTEPGSGSGSTPGPGSASGAATATTRARASSPTRSSGGSASPAAPDGASAMGPGGLDAPAAGSPTPTMAAGHDVAAPATAPAVSRGDDGSGAQAGLVLLAAVLAALAALGVILRRRARAGA